MPALRIQGLAFCAVGLAVALFSPLLPTVQSGRVLAGIAVTILFLGVPHGALDPVFAQQLHHIRSARGWLVFGMLYLLAAALVVAAWRMAPASFLVGFLLVSVVHFSGDLVPPMPLATRLLYGGAIIVLPAAVHADELVRLFSMLVDQASASHLTGALHWMAWPWFSALLIAALAQYRRDWRTALEIAAVGILAVVAAPLYAFVAFFCVMHAARHILRTAQYAGGRAGLPRLMMFALPPMVMTLAAAAFVALRMPDALLDTGLARIIFVGLAALTVPHMMLVERIRWRDWKAPDR